MVRWVAGACDDALTPCRRAQRILPLVTLLIGIFAALLGLVFGQMGTMAGEHYLPLVFATALRSWLVMGGLSLLILRDRAPSSLVTP